MRRREFIKGIAGSAAAWPLAAHAQPASRLPIIGFLGTDATAWSPWTAAFVARLRELGWIEGRTITIEYRWSEGRPERTTAFANVDKILHGTKPGSIPIEQPTKFDLVINLTTAKALGLTIPASLMSLADELIE